VRRTAGVRVARHLGRRVSRQESVIEFRVGAPVDDDALNALYAASWPRHKPGQFGTVLDRALTHVCAYDGDRLIGFVYLAWDGSVHAFLLDTTVHPDYRRRGIGRQIVEEAVAAARGRGITWIHVDYEPHLRHFYESCGFRPTDAGLINLEADARPDR
jgi:GNAT superfamily N-acetyltransferase